MIDDAGGWQHDTLTEDSDLSYRAQLKGWRFVYLPGLDCPSELPVEMHGFQVQQSRWAKGLTQVAKKLLPAILKADIPKRVKARSVDAPHAEHFVPADDRGLGADAAGDDHPVLHGLAADGLPRSASDRGVFLVDLALLRHRPARAVSEDLEANHPDAAHADGCRRRSDDHQHPRRAGSVIRSPDGIRAHPQVRDRRPSGESGSEEVPPPQRSGCRMRRSCSARISWR